MCIICQRASDQWFKAYNQGLIKLDTLEAPGPIVSQSTPEIKSAEYGSSTGNAIFNVAHPQGEYYVGKTLAPAYIITDGDEFDPSSVQIEWFQIDNGQFVSQTPIATTDSYTLTEGDVGYHVVYQISFTDTANNDESFLSYFANLPIVTSSYTDAPNSARTVVTYDQFETFLNDNNMGTHEASIRTLADTLQGKWGGELGTAPAQLTYSITGSGAIQYSDLQRAEHDLYDDIHINSGASATLNALAFSAEDVADIKQALQDWTNITGISFVENAGLGSQADIVFTKLDFQKWSDSGASTHISPASAGFAFTPSIEYDFIGGDIFLSSDLVPRNLDTAVYSLTSSHVSTPDLYVLRGNDTDGYDAYLVNYDPDTGVYTMDTPDTPTQQDVFSLKADIISAGLTIDGHLQPGMSVKGVASHEIGHALGLAHPHDGHQAVGDGNSPYSDDLVKSYDTVMSYEGEGYYLTDTPMMFDYHIMKGLYGGNQSSTGDDSYIYNVDEFHTKLDSGNSRAGFNVREMLHDPDGIDSVALVSQWKTPGADGVYFNLNMGSSSNFEGVTPITDDGSKLLNANLILSDYTQIENLMTTAGNDVVDATVTWAVSVDLADGNDEVSTNGHGGSFDGGTGTDRLTIHTTDLSQLYVEAASATQGAVRNLDGTLYCEATDFEFISLIEGVASPQEFTSWTAIAQLMPPSNPSIPAKPSYGDVQNIDTENAFGTHAAGDYIILEQGGNYFAYQVSGAGTEQSPYVIADGVWLETMTAQALTDLGAAEFTISEPAPTIPAKPSYGDVQNIDTENAFGTHAAGDYIILEQGGNYFAYQVSGAGTEQSPYVIADGVWLETMTAQALTDLGAAEFTIGIQVTPVFEIVRVDEGTGPNSSGGRYGAIETFGIQLKDDGDAGTSGKTFTNIDLQINWEQGEYMFWGNYQPGTGTPINSSDTTADALILDDISLIQQNPNADELNLALYDTNGITYAEGAYLATFMMERTDTSGSTSNDITLTTSQYNELGDATLLDPVPIPKSPPAEAFDFDYDAHDVKIKLSNARGEEADHPRLFVSNGSVSDGLSIVPVAKVGHIVKYAVVLNISRPTFIDSTATVAASQGISIYGADIFKQSVVDLTGVAEAGSQTAEILASASSTITVSESDSTAVASTMITASADLKGHEFFEIAAGALNPEVTTVDETALDTVDSLFLSFSNLAKPTTTTVATPTDAEGRYILAEFVAYGNNSDYDDIKFTSGKENASGVMVMGDEIVIDHIGGDPANATAAADQDKNTDGEYINFWTETIADGSDIVLLGEGVFDNPGDRLDAIGADDALAALYVARGGADGTVTYNQSQIIAADFNESGSVTSADAFDILQYSVFGVQPNGAVPKWVYVDDIESGSSTGGGGTSSVVDYDPNIDLFVGSPTNIEATAVLIGDVSESYQPLTDGSSSRWYGNQLEMFLTRVDVNVDPTGPLLSQTVDSVEVPYDNDATPGSSTDDGLPVAVAYQPEAFVFTAIPTVDTAFTLDGVDWSQDLVELAIAEPDYYDRHRYDTDNTDGESPEDLANEFFEAGEVGALMLDFHTGDAASGTQVFYVDLDSDGALTATDLAITFMNVDKNAFDDGSSIMFTA